MIFDDFLMIFDDFLEVFLMIFDYFRMISWCTLGVISEHNFLHGCCWVAPTIRFSNKLLGVFFIYLTSVFLGT